VAALCLPETNVNWNLPHQRDMFSGLLQKTWRNSAFSASPPPEEFLSGHQPGGTATVICDNWTSMLIERGEDPLGVGRWSYIMLHGKGAAKITIVMAYNATQSYGDTTNFQQQYRVLSRLHRDQGQQMTANPRRQFILDLQAWLESRIAEGHDLIIGMEFIMVSSALSLPPVGYVIHWHCNTAVVRFLHLTYAGRKGLTTS